MSERTNRGQVKRAAPTDAKCADAWDRIMDIARAHALVVNAYGGVATLAIPEEQRKAGLRAQVLDSHAMTEAAA